MRSVKKRNGLTFPFEFLLPFCEAALRGIHVFKNTNSGRMGFFLYTFNLACGVEVLS